MTLYLVYENMGTTYKVSNIDTHRGMSIKSPPLSTAAPTFSSQAEKSEASLPNSPFETSIPRVSTTVSKIPEDAATTKFVHTLILDASPLLLNQPSVSALLATAERLVTSPSVLAEIRDASARSRVETTYLPFLEVLKPSQTSLTVIREFAKKTGDLAVLSNVDLEVLALAYGNEVERNGGDWRLRSSPGQKRLNGKPPGKLVDLASEEIKNSKERTTEKSTATEIEQMTIDVTQTLEATSLQDSSKNITAKPESLKVIPTLSDQQTLTETSGEDIPSEPQRTSDEPDSGSDSDGWITPNNLRRHQTKDKIATSSSNTEPKTLQVATVTDDFAMQNVLLQMNLNLLSPVTCKRIQNIRTTVLRCHGCFTTCRDLSKQFCQRCGKPTLTRVSCTTNDRGEVKLHLKKNMQWNNRGNVYSIPNPVSGSSNQKWKGSKSGGGKGGWGNHLILAPDQKEYERALAKEKRGKERDLMDEDAMPRILTGERGSGGGRIKIGAGRNVNSRRR